VKFKNLHKAVETYEEMVNLGLHPSHVTYGILIKGYGNEKDYEGVMGMFEKLKASTPKINDVTYGGLIDACTKCDRMDSAMNFFRVMSQDADAKISPVVYSLLIKGFTNSRNFEKAYEVYRHMLSN
jgi:pentatricopeptide repeat protein